MRNLSTENFLRRLRRNRRAECVIAICCQNKGQVSCSECSHCILKAELIAEFNSLGIEDMEKVTDLNSLLGSYVNLEYTLPSGQKIKFWDDNKSYLGNQICKKTVTNVTV